MLTVYGVYRSRATRPIWLLNELGLPFRHVPVIQSYRLADPAAAQAPLNTASAAFLAINPAGAIPSIDDDGLVLSESLAITLHLARKAGGPLAPADAGEDAQMLQWSFYAVSAIEAPALEILYTQAAGGAETPEGRAVIDAAAAKLRRPLALLAGHLAAAGQMVGGRFTVADINVAECLRYAQGHPTLLAEFPVVKAWLEAAQARPAFQAMWQARAAEPA